MRATEVFAGCLKGSDFYFDFGRVAVEVKLQVAAIAIKVVVVYAVVVFTMGVLLFVAVVTLEELLFTIEVELLVTVEVGLLFAVMQEAEVTEVKQQEAVIVKVAFQQTVTMEAIDHRLVEVDVFFEVRSHPLRFGICPKSSSVAAAIASVANLCQPTTTLKEGEVSFF